MRVIEPDNVTNKSANITTQTRPLNFFMKLLWLFIRTNLLRYLLFFFIFSFLGSFWNRILHIQIALVEKV
jgi:hypothetical protein